jgi:hypothetical protein
MPYFKNILLIHIPKTGGSSVTKYLHKKFSIPLNNDTLFGGGDKNGFRYSLQHLTYRTIMQNKKTLKINEKDLEIISIVRNPYERAISDLFWIKKININTPKEKVFGILKKHIEENVDNHGIPQYEYVTDEHKKIIPSIKILHTETLQQDMINIGYTDFDIVDNKNKHSVKYYDYLDKDSISFINSYYDYDFKLFKYQKITN